VVKKVLLIPRISACTLGAVTNLGLEYSDSRCDQAGGNWLCSFYRNSNWYPHWAVKTYWIIVWH